MIELIIAAGIMSVIALGMTSLVASQFQETKALSEKLGSLELHRTVSQAVATSTSCGANVFAAANLVVPTSLPFDATSISAASPYVFALKQLLGTGVNPALLSGGDKVSVISASLFLNPDSGTPPGIEVRVTSPVSAAIVLNFDQTKLVRRLRSLEIPVSISTTGPITATQISAGLPGGGPYDIDPQSKALSQCRSRSFLRKHLKRFSGASDYSANVALRRAAGSRRARFLALGSSKLEAVRST